MKSQNSKVPNQSKNSTQPTQTKKKNLNPAKHISRDKNNTTHHLLLDTSSSNNDILTVQVTTPTSDPTVEKGRSRSACQHYWLCLLRFQQLFSFFASLANGVVSLLRISHHGSCLPLLRLRRPHCRVCTFWSRLFWFWFWSCYVLSLRHTSKDGVRQNRLRNGVVQTWDMFFWVEIFFCLGWLCCIFELIWYFGVLGFDDFAGFEKKVPLWYFFCSLGVCVFVWRDYGDERVGRLNGLWWCCPNFYSFIFLATKQGLKKNWEMILLGFEDVGFGIYDFFLMVFLCWIFWVYEFAFWVYEFYLLEVSLLIERWENLGLSWDFVYLGFVVWENLRRSAARFVFVFLLEIDLCLCLDVKKGQENARKFGHMFLCLKSGFVFFVLVENEPKSGQLIFFLLLKFLIIILFILWFAR